MLHGEVIESQVAILGSALPGEEAEPGLWLQEEVGIPALTHIQHHQG